MAKVIGDGTRKRGRKKEALRQAAEELAPTVKAGKGDASVTVTLIPGEGRSKGETVTLTLPKGAVVVPFTLTREKADANVRQQMRQGAAEVGARVSIGSHAIMLDDGTEATVWHFAAKEGND